MKLWVIIVGLIFVASWAFMALYITMDVTDQETNIEKGSETTNNQVFENDQERITNNEEELEEEFIPPKLPE